MIASEPHQAFWHSLVSVKRVIKELRALSINDISEKEKVEDSFREYITSCIREMKQKSYLDYPKQKEFLDRRMKYFVMEVKNGRFNIISLLIENESVEFNKLTKKQQQKFIKFKPKHKENLNQYVKVDRKDNNENEEHESSILQQVSHDLERFPPLYRFITKPCHENELKSNMNAISDKFKKAQDVLFAKILKPRVKAPISKSVNLETIKRKGPRLILTHNTKRQLFEPIDVPNPNCQKDEVNIYN